MNFFETRDSQWITMGAGEAAPYFFTTFVCDGATQGVQAAICGLGYYELYINGQKVGDRELAPIVSVYDRRARFNRFDVSDYVQKGVNSVGVVLGHGWYNHKTQEVWNFAHASWTDVPKLRMEVRSSSGGLLLGSNRSWVGSMDGPITFTQLRNGEHYDARHVFEGWPGVAFEPDTRWRRVDLIAGPGGVLEEETARPCRVVETFDVADPPNGFGVRDIGTNISGRCRIVVQGWNPGATVSLDYAERITEDGDLSGLGQDTFVRSGRFQHEEYVMQGLGAEEVWESRFTYHGFRYVKVSLSGGGATIRKIEVRRINTDLDTVGELETDSTDLNRLQALTRTSFLANFVGIPTDCPHREKNGWTGDAQLACETGLFNFDVASSYLQWIDTLGDCQRPSGELPGIAPSAGFGYNWGNGPNWDGALFVIPHRIYLHTGDDTALRKHYEAMRRYLDFCDSVSEDGIVRFGLGDWCPPLDLPMVDPFFSTTAAYYGLLMLFVEIATWFGNSDDATRYGEQARQIRDQFNRAFYHGNGRYADGGLTALGTPLYYGLCPDEEKASVVRALVAAATRVDCRAQFGILGAKMVPRALAENGHADLALRFFTQEAFPGWVHWLRRGAVSLWENWEGHTSRNHIMFGDPSAWLFTYAAGFRHQPEHPGWRRLTLRPHDLQALSQVSATYRGYASRWWREAGVFMLQLHVPEACTADVVLPDGTVKTCPAGDHRFRSDPTSAS